MCISTDSIFVDTDRKEKMSETTWSCTRCKSPLKENHYCPNCDINPMERIKQLEDVSTKLAEQLEASMGDYTDANKKIKQLEEEISILDESISEYDKAVNTLQALNEQLESILKSVLIETENGLKIRQLTRNKVIDILGT